MFSEHVTRLRTNTYTNNFFAQPNGWRTCRAKQYNKTLAADRKRARERTDAVSVNANRKREREGEQDFHSIVQNTHVDPYIFADVEQRSIVTPGPSKNIVLRLI